MFCFFFSSRRRHTRSYGDWSSDVCSSDLRLAEAKRRAALAAARLHLAADDAHELAEIGPLARRPREIARAGVHVEDARQIARNRRRRRLVGRDAALLE